MDRRAADRNVGFGNDPELACPHLVNRRCTVWASRDAVCATWHCRLDRGADGQVFWLALRAWLQCLERVLARFAADALAADGWRWGDTTASRERWYLEAAQRVERLSWDEVRRLGGFELRTRTRELRRADVHRRDPPPVPSPHALAVAPFERRSDGVRAWSPWDRLELSADVIVRLDRGDIPDDTSLLRALWDHRVVVPRDYPDGAPEEETTEGGETPAAVAAGRTRGR